MRTGGEPLTGKTLQTVDEQKTKDYQALIVRQHAEMRDQFRKKHPVGFSELRAESFGFTGEVLNDFASLSHPKFENFSRHIGMPADIVLPAAVHILRIYE